MLKFIHVLRFNHYCQFFYEIRVRFIWNIMAGSIPSSCLSSENTKRNWIKLVIQNLHYVLRANIIYFGLYYSHISCTSYEAGIRTYHESQNQLPVRIIGSCLEEKEPRSPDWLWTHNRRYSLWILLMSIITLSVTGKNTFNQIIY